MDITSYLTECVEKKIPVSFSKYGDGEYLCASGSVGQNCDRDPYTDKLRIKLRESVTYMVDTAENAHLGLWSDNVIGFWKQFVTKEIKWAKYHTMIFDEDLHHKTQSMYAKLKLYKAIKNSSMKKIMICNPLMIKAKILLNIDVMIHVPLCGWFDSQLDTIISSVKSSVTDEPFIMLTSCGMGAKVLIYEIRKLFPQGIFLDLGCALDQICTKKNSRGKQNFYEILLAEFKNEGIIPNNWDDPIYDDVYKNASTLLGVHLPYI